MRLLKVILAFIAGMIIGEGIPIIWYIIATNYFDLSDRDGGGAMGMVFILGPLLAVVVGSIAAIVAVIRTRPRPSKA